MLMEYLAEATIAERRSQFAACALGAEAARLNGRGWFARVRKPQSYERASRSRSAASTAGHSLSMME